MTDPQTPATEAGRRFVALESGADKHTNEVWLRRILAIEAEARADFWRDFDRYAFSHPEVPGNDLRASMERLEATLRAAALREAAEALRRVTVVTTTGVAAVTWIEIEAILDPQP